MTTPELITDEIVDKAQAIYDATDNGTVICSNYYAMRAAILAIQDDITRSWINAMQGYKQDAEAYERALKIIRANKSIDAQEIADAALKGYYHKTDFTEYCEQNPITEE